MKKVFNIFVEGVADARFFKQYIRHVFGEVIADERIVTLKGWDLIIAPSLIAGRTTKKNW